MAHLYGLSEPPLTHIFATFHEGWDYAIAPNFDWRGARNGETLNEIEPLD